MNDTPQTPLAGIGHNSPPIQDVLAETQAALIARVEPIAARANALPKKIESEDDLAEVTPVVVDAKSLKKDMEGARTDEKKPYLEGGRAVDAFFKPHTDRMDKIVSVFERLASDFQREKIAEERRKAAEAARKAEAEAARLQQEAEAASRDSTRERKLDAAAEAQQQADLAAAAAQRSAVDLGKVSTAGGTVRATAFWDFSIEDYNKVDLNALRDFLDRDAVEKAIKARLRIQKGNTEIPGVKVFENTRSSIR